MENEIVMEDLLSFVSHFRLTGELKNSSFLVTGSTGLIGSFFIKCLLELNEKKNAGIKIYAIARNPKKAKSIIGSQNVKWIFQDVVEPINYNIDKVDFIVHCASPTSSKFYVNNPVETINTIVDGTKNILEFAKRKKIRKLVYLSSLEIYGAVLENFLVNEDYSGYINPLDVRSSYSLGKRMAECLCCSYCNEYGVPVTIARLTQSFGAGVSSDDNRVFAQFAKSIIKGGNLELHTEGKSSKPYCYTVDVITAIITLLLYGKSGEAYNVANKTTYISIADMAKFLIESFNSDCKVVVNKREDMGYAPTTLLKLDTFKIESLGWKPTYDLLSMFSQLIKYYKTKN